MADEMMIDEMEKLYAETQMRIRQALGFKEAENVLALLRDGLRMRRMEGAGWMLTRKEPTVEMMQAGYFAWLDADKTQIYGEAIADHCYRAMLERLPPPPDEKSK